MNQSPQPLVVDAGPVGKKAALCLAREGIPARIIDSAEQPSEHFKVLAVNSRTREILDSTGNTEKKLEIDPAMRAVQFRLEDCPPCPALPSATKAQIPFHAGFIAGDDGTPVEWGIASGGRKGGKRYQPGDLFVTWPAGLGRFV